MRNKINELLIQLENEIESSPKPRLGLSNKRIVNFDSVMDLIGDIKVSIPEEVRMSIALLKEKEVIIERAKIEAAEFLSKARRECERLVARQSIIAEAKERAQGLIVRAESNADVIAQGARNYADGILEDLNHYLSEYIEIIDKNRAELDATYSIEKKQTQEPSKNSPNENEEAFETGKQENYPTTPAKTQIEPPAEYYSPPEENQTQYYTSQTEQQEADRLIERAQRGEVSLKQEGAHYSQEEQNGTSKKTYYIDENGEFVEKNAQSQKNFEPNENVSRNKTNDVKQKKSESEVRKPAPFLEDSQYDENEELYDLPADEVFKEIFGKEKDF